MKLFINLTLLSILSISCSHSVHQFYVGSMDQNARYGKAKWVTATSEDFVVLGFQGSTGYVEQAYRKLEQQCAGRISQVTTEYLTSFQFLSYDQKLVVRGLCHS